MTVDPGAIPNSGPQQPPQGPSPLVKPDSTLIGDLLEQLGIKHGIDETGDIVASWPGFRLHALFRHAVFQGENKEMLLVRAIYEREYPLENKPELLGVIDEWHRESLYPKVYTHTDDKGVLRLVGESGQMILVPQGVNVDYFVASFINWVEASIGFNAWLAQRLGLEAGVDSAGRCDDDEPDGAP